MENQGSFSPISYNESAVSFNQDLTNTSLVHEKITYKIEIYDHQLKMMEAE